MESEELIVKRCQQGQPHEFGQLYDAYIAKIYNFIYYRTHHRQTAEDLTSLTFTKAFVNIHSFSPEYGTFSAWLHRIARNNVIDHYRTFKPMDDITNAFDLSSKDDIERDVDTLLKIEKIKEYLQTLPSEHKDLVIMRVWDQLSYKEISEILGKSEASLKVSFSRIMAKMHNEMAIVILLLILCQVLELT